MKQQSIYDHVRAVFGDKLVTSSTVFLKSLEQAPVVTMGYKPAIWIISHNDPLVDIVREHYEHMLAKELAEGTGDGIIDPYGGPTKLTYALRKSGWDMHLTRFQHEPTLEDIQKFAADYHEAGRELVYVCIDVERRSYEDVGELVKVKG